MTENDLDPNSDLRELRVKRDSPVTGSRDAFAEMTNQLLEEILAEEKADLDLTDIAIVRNFVHDYLDIQLAKKGVVLNRYEKRQLLDAIVASLIEQTS